MNIKTFKKYIYILNNIKMAERLNDVYNNMKYTDSDFIIRSLNTILPNNS